LPRGTQVSAETGGTGNTVNINVNTNNGIFAFKHRSCAAELFKINNTR
jgi:hypothetical protein